MPAVQAKDPPQLNWAAMRPYELKKHCRGRGLAEAGSKAALVARLQGREELQPPKAVTNDVEAEAKAVALKEAAKAGSVADIDATGYRCYRYVVLFDLCKS